MTDLAAVIEAMAVTPSPIRTLPKTHWQLVIGPNSQGPQYELTMARQRNLTFHVDDSANLTFSIDGNDPALPYITELVTDIWVYRNGRLLYRGRIGSTTDSLDGESDTYNLQINTFDYREWLARQVLQPSVKWSWRAKTQATILNDLIQKCIRNQSGLKPTITVDTSKMPTSNVNFDVTAGTSIKETIGVMSGFGWQVFPNSDMGITLKAIAPWYYNINNHYALMYGASVSKITRTLDTSGYANSTIYTGDTKLAPVQSDASGIASKPEGRLALTLSNPAIVDKAHLTSAASNAAARLQSKVPTWDCQLTPGTWESADDAWIGDICQFVVNKGRLKINEQYRITDMTIAIADDSTHADTVTMTVAKPAYIPASV